MLYYSQQEINNNKIVRPQEILNNVKNSKKGNIVSLCLEIDNNDNMTPIIFVDNNSIGFNYYHYDKYVLPAQEKVIKTFKKYFTNDPKYLYSYYHNDKYYCVTSFKNSDNVVEMLETILEPVIDLLEQKEQLIFDD